jgi:hypothetical protein
MKLRQVTRQREVTEVLDGEKVTYPQDYTESVPGIPFNLDAALRKFVFAVALLMTAGAIVWGTVAIGSMLETLAPGWGYAVAGAFDLAWAACLAVEYHNRFDEKKIKLPRNAGIGALAISMAAITWHGHMEDELIVGIIGAAVSLVAKGVWFIAMQMVEVKLDKGYQALLRQRQQKAGLAQALAQSKRDQLLADAKTARLLAALEAEFGGSITTVERADEQPIAEAITADHAPEQEPNAVASNAPTSANTAIEGPSIADLAREQIAITKDTKVAVAAILAERPDANKDSVAAAVRRARKAADGPYL